MSDKKPVKSKDPLQKSLGALKAILDPKSVIAPPEHFDETQKAIWDKLISSKPHEAWRATDYFFLEMWVVCYTHLTILEDDIVSEGYVVMNARGTQIANPKIQAKNGYMSQWIGLSTKLRLTASSRDNDEEGNAGRNQEQQKAKRAAKVIAEDDDDLLASGQTYQ